MAIGKKTGGRTKGTPNKLSGTVKDNVIQVFDQIGGTQKMAEWAAENPTHFYNIYAKILPMQLAGDPDAPLSLTIAWQEPK